MGLNKDQILFDPAGSDEDNIGAYLKSSDGTLLTHTTDGGKEALDVHIAGSDLADFDIRDLSHTQDSVKVGDGTEFMEVNADGSINAVVSATDLDIRDLAFATDSVDVSGSSVTVSATDLDIRDLSHAQDSVKIGDGTDFLAVNSDGSIDVRTSREGFGSCANPAAATPGTSATQLITSALSNRASVILQNTGNKVVYIGCDSGVTAAKGIKLPKGASIELAYDDTIDIHGITSTGTGEIRVLEAAA